MKRPLTYSGSIAPLLLVTACSADVSREPEDRSRPSSEVPAALRTTTDADQLRAGSAEAWLDLPIGVPLAAYTARLEMGRTAPDSRSSQYCTEFEPSFGVQTRIPVKVIWLQNGDQNVVFVKVDLGYSFDGLLFGAQDAISAATGVNVVDQVIVATSHSHSSYGDFSNDVALYLGSDQFNTEIFEKMVSQISSVAQEAFANLAPAAIGAGFDPEFDPRTENRIFRDRRGENDDLVGPNGEVLGPGYKDPRLTLLRIDHSQGTATKDDDVTIAIIHSFGVHGTIMGEDNPLTSVETTGHIDLQVREQFTQPVVVMHLQGAAGDQSPAGQQDNFARMEYLAELATPKIMRVYENTTTRAGDVSIELLTRSISQDRDEMHIFRRGTVDYYYAPYTSVYRGDDIIYDADGTVLSPIDEFNTEFGAALCTDDESMEIIGRLWGWGSDAAPYSTCGNVDEIVAVMDLPIFEFDLSHATAPLLTAQTTVISTLKLGPLPIYSTDGTTADAPIVMGLFPGEPVSLYGDTFRNEIQEIYGYDYGVTIGYAQDHEGYLLTLEDWLAGGYEPEINQWGPIQGEYIMEQLVELIGQFGINDPNIPASSVPHTEYSYYPLTPAEPDVTVNAGTVPDRVPSYLYTYDGVRPSHPQPDGQTARVSGIATFLWIGGDPIVDLPSVVLERETAPNSDSFAVVTHADGRPYSEAGPEILLTWTPDPLRDTGPQTHYWLATFQAVNDDGGVDYSASLPAGRYRFQVTGRTMTTAGGSYPWNTDSYSLTSNTFDVVALAEMTVSATLSGSSLSVQASYPANERGFRLISMAAENERGSSPMNRGNMTEVLGDLVIYDAQGARVWSQDDVVFQTESGASSASITAPSLAPGEYSLKVTDVFGNLGRASFSVN